MERFCQVEACGFVPPRFNVGRRVRRLRRRFGVRADSRRDDSIGARRNTRSLTTKTLTAINSSPRYQDSNTPSQDVESASGNDATDHRTFDTHRTGISIAILLLCSVLRISIDLTRLPRSRCPLHDFHCPSVLLLLAAASHDLLLISATRHRTTPLDQCPQIPYLRTTPDFATSPSIDRVVFAAHFCHCVALRRVTPMYVQCLSFGVPCGVSGRDRQPRFTVLHTPTFNIHARLEYRRSFR